MRQICVGIGQHSYRASEGESHWEKTAREMSWRRTPILDLSRVPSSKEGMLWDFVSVHPSGFAVAVGYVRVPCAEDVPFFPRYLSSVFVSHDCGETWVKRVFKKNPSLWNKREASIPFPERFCRLAIANPNLIALVWSVEYDDVWFGYWDESHVIYSHDQGESWGLSSLGENGVTLKQDGQGRLLLMNDGYFLRSSNGRKWSKRKFRVQWPEDYPHPRMNSLSEVTFVEGNIGYALIEHGHTHMDDYTSDVGLLKSTDDGRSWNLLHVFPGLTAGEMYGLSLEVESR